MRVGVIDYGVGNLGSVVRALEELRVAPKLLTNPAELKSVDRLILPGVGNFADCARLLNEGGWPPRLKEAVLSETKPLLGVCVGMQLLANLSREGLSPQDDDKAGSIGLGLIPGRVVHLRDLGCKHRVPHVGWNSIQLPTTRDKLLNGIPDSTDFYFVHSFAFIAEQASDILATADYGIPIAAVIGKANVWGTQFHPEKSSKAGFKLLSNFIEEV